jgi:hypothetical protein
MLQVEVMSHQLHPLFAQSFVLLFCPQYETNVHVPALHCVLFEHVKEPFTHVEEQYVEEDMMEVESNERHGLEFKFNVEKRKVESDGKAVNELLEISKYVSMESVVIAGGIETSELP